MIALAACIALLVRGLPPAPASQDPNPAQSAAPATPAPPVPNVVLIVIDTLRPDYLELHGAAWTAAPFLHELGRSAAVFDHAFSSSTWTAPSAASVMTGLYPTDHGVVDGMMAHRRKLREAGDVEVEPEKLVLNAIPERIETIAEAFQSAGYRTIARTANLNVDAPMGFAQGFRDFECRRSANASDLTRELLDGAASLSSMRPLFLYLHFNDTHEPYQRRAPWYKRDPDPERDTVARYVSEIRAVDDQIRRLHAALGWSRDTILLVCSDHGEEFNDHGGTGHRPTLYYELNHVLMMIAAPGVTARRVGANVSLVDVLPTLVDLAGLPASDSSGAHDGVSLRPLLFGVADEPPPASFVERPVFCHRGSRLDKNYWWGVGLGRYRLTQWGDQVTRLFDFAADPGEKENLALGFMVARRPEVKPVLDRMLATLAAFRAKGIPAAEATTEITLDDAALEHLRELGYGEK